MLQLGAYGANDFKVLCGTVRFMEGLRSVTLDASVNTDGSTRRQARSMTEQPAASHATQIAKLCSSLARALQSSPGCTSLQFVGVPLSPDAISKLAKALYGLSRLRSLVMRDCQVNDRGFGYLCDCVRLSRSISEWDMSNNSLTDKSVSALAGVLKVRLIGLVLCVWKCDACR